MCDFANRQSVLVQDCYYLCTWIRRYAFIRDLLIVFKLYVKKLRRLYPFKIAK